MPSKRRKLLALAATLIGLAVLFFALRTEPARRMLARSQMCVGAYYGMRRDVRALRIRFRQRADQAAIRDYIARHSVRKLQLGAGDSRAEGWLNTDIDAKPGLVYLDASKPFPLDNGSFHYVFSEHLIEHLPFEAGADMLRETYRVLAPGGKVRIATPNLRALAALYAADLTDEMRRYVEGKIEWHNWPRHPSPVCIILNYEMRQFRHQFIYDTETLRGSLTRAGFTSIVEWAPGKSNDPHLRDLEMRRDDPLNNYETMVLEAVKP